MMLVLSGIAEPACYRLTSATRLKEQLATTIRERMIEDDERIVVLPYEDNRLSFDPLNA